MRPPYSEAETSRFVSVRYEDRDIRVHYNDCDPAEGSEVVVMLHGSGPGATSWANFSRNIAPLTDLGYRAVLIDCPGWGKSDPIVSRESRPDLNAHFVKGVVDALGLETVHLVGNSMGGHSAMAFTLTWPERVGKLILMGGGTGGTGVLTPQPTEGIKLLNRLYAEPTLANLTRMMEAFVFDQADLTEDLFRLRLANMEAQREHLSNFIESLRVNPRQYPDFGPRLSQVQAETLIVWGRDDRFVPLETGLRLLGGLPRARLHVFNRCGHWAQWEHAEPFNRLLVDFLQH